MGEEILMSKSSERMIKRFGLPFRIAHWIVAFSFLALYITALPMYTEFFDWLWPILGGPANARLLHRIFGVTLMVPLFIMLFFSPKALFHWLKSAFTWGKHDIQFLLAFPFEFFGKHKKYPKQDFYNAGEKMNSLLQLFCGIGIVGSGIIIWKTNWFPNWLVDIGYPIHAISVGLSVAVVIAHAYMGTFAPDGWKAFRGMVKGEVSEEWAKHHHGRWTDELEKAKKEKGA